MEFLEALFTALGLKFKVVIAGAIGAFVSLRFFDGLKTAERWMTFVGGWAIAAYLAGPVTLYLELPAAVELGMALGIGLFGMSIAAALIRVIKETDWTAIFKQKTGG